MHFRSHGPGTTTGPKGEQRLRPRSRGDPRLTVPVVSKTTVRLYPPDVAIIDAWAAANPDPDTGLTPSRPTAIRRMIRASSHLAPDIPPGADASPATRADLRDAVSHILNRVNPVEPLE